MRLKFPLVNEKRDTIRAHFSIRRKVVDHLATQLRVLFSHALERRVLRNSPLILVNPLSSRHVACEALVYTCGKPWKTLFRYET